MNKCKHNGEKKKEPTTIESWDPKDKEGTFTSRVITFVSCLDCGNLMSDKELER